jgi:hypothetical protein
VSYNRHKFKKIHFFLAGSALLVILLFVVNFRINADNIFSWAAKIVNAQEECHLLTSANGTPRSGYGAWYDVFKNKILIKVLCSSSSATITLGDGDNHYIYEKGYIWKNNRWQLINFTGSDKVSGYPWYKNSAQATISSLDLSKTNYIVAYFCTWKEDQWKCGCRDAACDNNYWQLQTFKARTSAAEEVGKWDIYEISLNSANSYTNPFKEVRLTAIFTSPSGKVKTITGFYDGGSNYKIRIAADELGVWTYKTDSNDSQLNNKTGSFKVVSSSNHGFLRTDPDQPHHFKFDDNTRMFILGQTHYSIAGYQKGGSYWQNNVVNTINYDASYKINKIRFGVFILKSSSEKFPSYYQDMNPWGGDSTSLNNPDYSRFRPSYWQKLETIIQMMGDKGIIADLILFNYRYPGRENAKFYLKYLMARLGGYSNVIFTLANEWNKGSASPYSYGWDQNEINYLGDFIKSIDPYGHHLSVHSDAVDVDPSVPFGNKNWYERIIVQYKTTPSAAYSNIVSNRRFSKPVINDEYGYEGLDQDAEDVRKDHWAITMAGGYASYGDKPSKNDFYGNSQPSSYKAGGVRSGAQGLVYLKHLYNFINQTGYWKMSPDNSLIRAGTGFALANPNKEYIIYLLNGGYFQLDLSSVNSATTFTAKWYNPRAGTYTPLSNVKGGGVRAFTAPDNNDWVLHLSTSSTGSVITVGSGEDPDIAIDSDGQLHVAYLRNGIIYYKKGGANGNFGQEYEVGVGFDPQIEVDSNNNPHIVMGSSSTYKRGPTIKYSWWKGDSFAAPIAVARGQVWKPRITIDLNNKIYISFEDLSKTRRINMVTVTFAGGTPKVNNAITIGDDGNGGLKISSNTVHFSWRKNAAIYYNTYSSGEGTGSLKSVAQNASDFTDLDISPKDGSIHIVGEVAYGKGIYYINREGGRWSSVKTYAESQVIGVDDPDNVNPKIAVDKNGKKYITFSGKQRIPYYFVIDENGQPGAVKRLNEGGGSLSGGKLKNANIDDSPNGGAYAVWGIGAVYLRNIK